MKKNLYLSMIGAVLLSLAMASCNVPMSKDSYVKGFAKFVDEVEAQGATYTLKDWDKAEDTFEKYTEDYYERFADKLTPEDQKALGRSAAKYAKVRMASQLKGLSEDIEDGANFMQGFAEEVGDDMDTLMSQMLQDMDEVSWDDDDD